MTVASAPGRINLIGEHTDYNAGLALPLAVAARTTVAFDPDGGRTLRLRSRGHEPADVELEAIAPGSITGWTAYVAGAAWALRRAGVTVEGGTVTVTSTLPEGLGLSSSAALCSAAVLALGGPRPGMETARLAHAAEAEFAGVPCGLLDQVAVCLAVPGHALLFDARDESATPVPLDLDGAGLRLLLVDSGVIRRVGATAYSARRESCTRAAAALGVSDLSAITDLGAALAELRAEPPDLAAVTRHVVEENARVREVVRLLGAGSAAAIGPLLTASHASLRDSYAVSCPELDAIVDPALAAGALGARLTGAGFGGCAIVLVDADHELSVQDALSPAGTDRQTWWVAAGGAARMEP